MFKVVHVCFALFVVTASGASVFKYGEEDKKDAVSEYTVDVPSSPGEVDVVYDFDKNLAMHRMSKQKACFLSDLTENLPKPEDLTQLLETENAQGIIQAKTSSEYLYVVVSTVYDRSILSDEMAALCAKLPIYRLKEKSLMRDVDKENHLQRVKRGNCTFVCRGPCPHKRRGNTIIITGLCVGPCSYRC